MNWIEWLSFNFLVAWQKKSFINILRFFLILYIFSWWKYITWAWMTSLSFWFSTTNSWRVSSRSSIVGNRVTGRNSRGELSTWGLLGDATAISSSWPSSFVRRYEPIFSARQHTAPLNNHIHWDLRNASLIKCFLQQTSLQN